MSHIRISLPTTIICNECGKSAPRTGTYQKFCGDCSLDRSNKRKAAYSAANATKRAPLAKARRDARKHIVKSAAVEAGKALSENVSLLFDTPDADFEWIVRFKVPFTQAASKNHIFSMGGSGHHIFKRTESRAFQEALALATKAALRGINVVENKVWIGIHVEKKNHKSDAINVLDLVCDGIKLGMPVDDRWFCVSFLDWSINKNDPNILIQIGQKSSEHARACSHCGRILDLASFNKRSSLRLGVDRVCRECKSLAGKIAKGKP